MNMNYSKVQFGVFVLFFILQTSLCRDYNSKRSEVLRLGKNYHRRLHGQHTPKGPSDGQHMLSVSQRYLPPSGGRRFSVKDFVTAPYKWFRNKKRAYAYKLWKSESKSEKHLPGYNYCGPGTKLGERLKRGDKPKNPLDAACKIHDMGYSKAKDMDGIQAADRALLDAVKKRKKELKATGGRHSAERYYAEGVSLAMKAKLFFGVF